MCWGRTCLDFQRSSVVISTESGLCFSPGDLKILGGLKGKEGVVVLGLEDNGPAWRSGKLLRA